MPTKRKGTAEEDKALAVKRQKEQEKFIKVTHLFFCKIRPPRDGDQMKEAALRRFMNEHQIDTT